MIEYRELGAQDIDRALFKNFVRTQPVKQCWRKLDGTWTIVDNPFVDDWDEKSYAWVVKTLQSTAAAGGLVVGAFVDNVFKGLVAVVLEPLGSKKQYMELSFIHVSQELRGTGIGRELFARARAFAKSHGAQKLYISAHSSVESQAFYRAMGCVEATEYDRARAEAEPCDCQLECVL